MTAERQRSCDGMWRSYETWRIRVPVCSHALRGPWGLAERPARAVRTPVGVLHDSCATPCAPWRLGVGAKTIRTIGRHIWRGAYRLTPQRFIKFVCTNRRSTAVSLSGSSARARLVVQSRAGSAPCSAPGTGMKDAPPQRHAVSGRKRTVTTHRTDE